MNYKESRVYLDELSRYGSVLGLGSMRELLHRLGDPQDELKFIHVAGTNGKGSILSYLSNILIQAGYTTGGYFSPWLFEYGEQFQVNGVHIIDDELARHTTVIAEAISGMVADGLNSPTLFEAETALAMVYFKSRGCDFVVLETGLGGRGDATNVVNTTLVEVITPISKDHMAFLGETIKEIAGEKAGIIKPNTIAVSAKQHEDAEEVLAAKCDELGSELRVVDEAAIEPISYGIGEQRFNYSSWKDVTISLAGVHQFSNASLAILAIEALRDKGVIIPDKAIYDGLKAARWFGRFTELAKEPTVIIDGAHNEGAAIALESSICQYFGDKKVILVIGVFKDKEYNKLLSHLVPLSKQVITVETPNNDRAMPAHELREKVLVYSEHVEAAESICQGMEKAYEYANKHEVILVCGSLSFLGDVKRIVERRGTNHG